MVEDVRAGAFEVPQRRDFVKAGHCAKAVPLLLLPLAKPACWIAQQHEGDRTKTVDEQFVSKNFIISSALFRAVSDKDIHSFGSETHAQTVQTQ